MNFDTIIDRRGTGALKWDNKLNMPGQADIIPLWVADMDFAAPDAVVAALQRRASHPIIGYTNPPADYFALLANWYRVRYGLTVPASDFMLAPAVMPAIAIALRAFTTEGDGVIIMPPVYYPFFELPRANGRVVVEVPLLNPAPGQWRMDFAGIEAAVAQAPVDHKIRAILLSSPHNPGGRVWTPDELRALDALASRHGLYILSDEIHADIVFAPQAFTSLASDEFSNPRCLVFAGPNKTFNIAGLHICHVIARDSGVRTTMQRAIAAAGFSQPNAFSLTAAIAAYQECASWVDELKDYLADNFRFLEGFLRERVPGVSSYVPEGTYLAWVDCRTLLARVGLKDDRELARILEETGRVKVSAGSIFGSSGTGFVRINVACPRELLKEGLERLARTVADLG